MCVCVCVNQKPKLSCFGLIVCLCVCVYMYVCDGCRCEYVRALTMVAYMHATRIQIIYAYVRAYMQIFQTYIHT